TSIISPVPASTLQILRWSELGCGVAETTCATTNLSSRAPWLSMLSTSRPIMVSALPISSTEAVVSRCSLSQSSVNFIFWSLAEVALAARDRRQRRREFEQFDQHIGKAARIVDGPVRMGDMAVKFGRQLAHAPIEIGRAAQRSGHGVKADPATAKDLPSLERAGKGAGPGKFIEGVIHPQPVENHRRGDKDLR